MGVGNLHFDHEIDTEQYLKGFWSPYVGILGLHSSNREHYLKLQRLCTMRVIRTFLDGFSHCMSHDRYGLKQYARAGVEPCGRRGR